MPSGSMPAPTTGRRLCLVAWGEARAPAPGSMKVRSYARGGASLSSEPALLHGVARPTHDPAGALHRLAGLISTSAAALVLDGVQGDVRPRLARPKPS